MPTWGQLRLPATARPVGTCSCTLGAHDCPQRLWPPRRWILPKPWLRTSSEPPALSTELTWAHAHGTPLPRAAGADQRCHVGGACLCPRSLVSCRSGSASAQAGPSACRPQTWCFLTLPSRALSSPAKCEVGHLPSPQRGLLWGLSGHRHVLSPSWSWGSHAGDNTPRGRTPFLGPVSPCNLVVGSHREPSPGPPIVPGPGRRPWAHRDPRAQPWLHSRGKGGQEHPLPNPKP